MRWRDKSDAASGALRGVVSDPVPAPTVVFVDLIGDGAALLGAEDL